MHTIDFEQSLRDNFLHGVEYASIAIRPSAMAEFDDSGFRTFLQIGLTHHCTIIEKTKDFDERLYYIHACANGPWLVEQLHAHIRADGYRHVGMFSNQLQIESPGLRGGRR